MVMLRDLTKLKGVGRLYSRKENLVVFLTGPVEITPNGYKQPVRNAFGQAGFIEKHQAVIWSLDKPGEISEIQADVGPTGRPAEEQKLL